MHSNLSIHGFRKPTNRKPTGEPASNLLQLSESWNMFDWYREDELFNQDPAELFQNQAVQTVDTMSSQWLGSFLTL